MQLNNIRPHVKNQSSTRVGRGTGSGKGKTSGRGHKGQRSRSGFSTKLGFEGGQTPLCRRLPKYGFRSFKKKFQYGMNFNKIEDWRMGCQELSVKLLKTSRRIDSNTRLVKIFNHKPERTSGHNPNANKNPNTISNVSGV